MIDNKTALFPLGLIVCTQGVEYAIEDTGDNIISFIKRHNMGDWGDMPEEDKLQNDMAVRLHDRRIFSSYHLSDGTVIWIITEWDFSSTTVLLPDEY